jgi:hypothetical protein
MVKKQKGQKMDLSSFLQSDGKFHLIQLLEDHGLMMYQTYPLPRRQH